jgi:hypothetical protein
VLCDRWRICIAKQDQKEKEEERKRSERSEREISLPALPVCLPACQSIYFILLFSVLNHDGYRSTVQYVTVQYSRA